MPSKDREILNRNAKKHWDKIKDDPEVKRKARERAKAWYEANKQRAKEWAEANKEKRKEQLREWKEKNPERVKEHKAKSQKNNMESHLRRMKKYRETHGGKLIAQSIRDSYRRRLREQSLNMYDKEKILEIYKHCKELKRLTGVDYEVDHIIAIKCKEVCGLHVSWNLQIIPAKQNRQKTNKLID